MAAKEQAARPADASREVECIETGDRWRNSAAAARAVGVTKSAVYMAARSGGSCCGLHWRIEGHEVPSTLKRKPYHRCPVENVDTGEVFASFRQAADSIGASRPALSRAVISGGRCGGFYWRRAGAATTGKEDAKMKADSVKGTAAWPRWDDGDPIVATPPIELKDGRRVARLLFDDGMWFLLDESGDQLFSLAVGERLPRSIAAQDGDRADGAR